MVDKKYYISDKAKIGMLKSSYVSRKKLLQQKDICNTLCARDYKEPKCIITNGGGYREDMTEEEIKKLAIRKLMPIECWNLMGFSDEAFYKAKAVPTSDMQLYKQAGNSIVVDCLYYILKNLLFDVEEPNTNTTIFDYL